MGLPKSSSWIVLGLVAGALFVACGTSPTPGPCLEPSVGRLEPINCPTVTPTHTNTPDVTVVPTNTPTPRPGCEDSSNATLSAVRLSEWVITCEIATESPARFEAQNVGSVDHQLAIWKGGAVEGDNVVGGDLVGQTDIIQAGQSATLEVTLEPGDYILVCPVPGHTGFGMHASFSVSGP